MVAVRENRDRRCLAPVFSAGRPQQGRSVCLIDAREGRRVDALPWTARCVLLIRSSKPTLRDLLIRHQDPDNGQAFSDGGFVGGRLISERGDGSRHRQNGHERRPRAAQDCPTTS